MLTQTNNSWGTAYTDQAAEHKERPGATRTNGYSDELDISSLYTGDLLTSLTGLAHNTCVTIASVRSAVLASQHTRLLGKQGHMSSDVLQLPD